MTGPMAAGGPAFWGHALAALGYALLSLWVVRRGRRGGPAERWLLAGLCLTALWALVSLRFGTQSWPGGLSEAARNACWLVFALMLMRSAGSSERTRAIDAIFAALGLVVFFDCILVLAVAFGGMPAAPRILIGETALAMRMIFAAGALLVIHNVYTIAAPDARRPVAQSLGALAVMWTYDLNLYAIASIGHQLPWALLAARGFAVAALVPLFLIALQGPDPIRVRLSRTVAFRSMSLVVIGLYLGAMLLLAIVVQLIGGEFVGLAQVAIFAAMSAGALLVLPSPRFRSWMRVTLAKHFFQHRYDYRAEWSRFTETIGLPASDGATLAERAVQGIADICDSPAGIMFVPQSDGSLSLEARWNWQGEIPPDPFNVATVPFFEETGYIVEMDALRAGSDERVELRAVPQWLYDEQRAWAVVPCVHFGRLAGLAVLARPRVPRGIDWEDLDMLRVVGRQVASYLAEARGQAALVEAGQFDEFNRRFAFILHDIKNLVSQLTLVARNAERHADNPEFRADMIATLRDSAGRMNDLLARLSQHNKGRATPPVPISLSALMRGLPAIASTIGQFEVEIEDNVIAIADPARTGTIVAHLVQNAVEASEPGATIRILVRRRGDRAVIDVIDQGCGMDERFVRTQLFKPFSSTKAGGFGIGAYESRALAEAMGGRLEVDSQPGRGTRIQLILPLAAAADTPSLREKAA